MKKRDKKAQVTLFIILGVIVVASIGTYFAISQGAFNSSNSKFPEVNSLVESCLEEVTLNGIYFNSLQGGYYNVPENSIKSGFIELPLYFDGEKNLPALSVWESELSNYIEASLDFCLNFSDLESKGYSITKPTTISAETKIRNSQVEVTLSYPLTVSKEDVSVQLKNFKKTIAFDYLAKYNALSEFLEIQNEEPEWIPFTQTQEIGKKYGFSFETAPIKTVEDKTDYLYGFKYLNTTKHKNQDYFLVFGVRYKT